MNVLIPTIQGENFAIQESEWQALQAEVTSVLARIDGGAALTPEDVKGVKQLAKNINEYGVLYRRAVTQKANEYKQYLDAQLESIGYGRIEAFIEEKKCDQRNETAQRMTTKMAMFQTLVHEHLKETPILAQSPIAENITNLLVSRFPKMNSGAISNEIKNWKPIESVIKAELATVESVLVPISSIISLLGGGSNTIRNLSSYIRSGDKSLVDADHVKQLLEADKGILQQAMLKQKLQTADDAVAFLSNILNDTNITSEVKIQRVQDILNVYHAQ